MWNAVYVFNEVFIDTETNTYCLSYCPMAIKRHHYDIFNWVLVYSFRLKVYYHHGREVTGMVLEQY